MRSASDYDAVTLDAFGTLVELTEPAERLRQALARRRVERDSGAVAEAFAAESRYYLGHKLRGRDAESLRVLRVECTRVFLEPLKTGLDPEEFAADFVESLLFHPLDGSVRALRALRDAGLALACVSGWDVGLAEQLERAGLGEFFSVVVSSAEVGIEKPDPAVFAAALERLSVAAERALHCGDEDADRDGAEAAGMAFEPAPLATLPERLGL
jgi:HAD superfamily hydrolase (TIGR01509 family)